jgi:hypothetical protein
MRHTKYGLNDTIWPNMTKIEDIRNNFKNMNYTKLLISLTDDKKGLNSKSKLKMATRNYYLSYSEDLEGIPMHVDKNYHIDINLKKLA